MSLPSALSRRVFCKGVVGVGLFKDFIDEVAPALDPNPKVKQSAIEKSVQALISRPLPPPPISLDTGSPFSEFQLQLATPGLGTVGQRINSRGAALYFKRNGSAPHAVFDIDIGGKISDVRPGTIIRGNYSSLLLTRKNRIIEQGESGYSTSGGVANFIVMQDANASLQEGEFDTNRFLFNRVVLMQSVIALENGATAAFYPSMFSRLRFALQPDFTVNAVMPYQFSLKFLFTHFNAAGVSDGIQGNIDSLKTAMVLDSTESSPWFYDVSIPPLPGVCQMQLVSCKDADGTRGSITGAKFYSLTLSVLGIA